MPKVPEIVQDLVGRFEQNIDEYKSPKYSEALIRVEFVNPLWKALGWDIDNESGYSMAYRDVIHEAEVKVGGTRKAPDYSFRIGGTRKFFLETKKPAVNLRDDPASAFQLRRYAYSAKLPISVLTDFEEFIIYECYTKPSIKDKPSAGRVKCYDFRDYVERWDEISSVFSKDAVMKGALDRFAEGSRGKRGTAEIDEDFVVDLDDWRLLLARNIALRNGSLTTAQLNRAVQLTIDRLVFLRMCEDRGIEDYGQMLSLTEEDGIYRELVEVYYKANRRYNSGLFHFTSEKHQLSPPDKMTPTLNIDDSVLRNIVRRLYYPHCPYEFSILPVEVLGNAYEQFLGKIVRLTKGHRASIEEKPEVRKAGGVYYTPKYVVDYIVGRTVGKICRGKTPKSISDLHFLDPACGSGSFLLGAYQYLLDWHLAYYLRQFQKNGRLPTIRCGEQKRPRKSAPQAIYQGNGGQWHLTTGEKKRILTNNIYGLDIDANAVEVTKLSLLLKVLENEDQDTLEQQLALWHERALPDLGSNIKCGNSLIGPDFSDQRRNSLLGSSEDESDVNAFDWYDVRHGFGEIMKKGGFDAIFGNPPYVRVRVFKALHPRQADYMESHYECASHVWDIYLLFFERSIEMARKSGMISFIVPIQTLHQPNCESLRRILAGRTSITEVADLSKIRVFRGPIVKNCIITCRKGLRKNQRIAVKEVESADNLAAQSPRNWPQAAVRSNPGHSLKIDLLSPKKTLCDKLRRRSWELEELCYSTFGMRSCAKGTGGGGKDRLVTTNPRAKHARPYLEGRDIKRYVKFPTGRYIRYVPQEMYSPRSPDLFERQKIISQSMLSRMRLVATLDTDMFYVEQSLVCVIPNGVLNDRHPVASLPLEYILGVINSRLESFYFGTYVIDYSLGGGLIHATPGSHDRLIIPKGGATHIDRMVNLVTTMLDLHRRLQSVTTSEARTRLERQIAHIDSGIDGLVYALYNLTSREISMVEDTTIST